MKKERALFFILAGLLAISCTFTSCSSTSRVSKTSSIHEHIYSSHWDCDEEYHWHNAICVHSNEKKDYEKHSFGSWVIEREATEHQDGFKHRTCRVCQYTDGEDIPMLEHTHKPGEPFEEYRMEASCTEDGESIFVVLCTECNEELSRTRTILPALGHDLVQVEAKAATCTEDGYNAYEFCKRCGYSTKEVVKATNHDFVRNEETLVYECSHTGCNETNGRDYEMELELNPLHVADTYEKHNATYSFKNDDNALSFVFVSYEIDYTTVSYKSSGSYIVPDSLVNKLVLAHVYIGVRDATNVKISGNRIENCKVIFNGVSYSNSGKLTSYVENPEGEWFGELYSFAVPLGTVLPDPRDYTVTWTNYDDSVIKTDTLHRNDIPSYNGETPRKPLNGAYTHLFTGWSPSVEKVTGDATYKATFNNSRLYFGSYPQSQVTDEELASELTRAAGVYPTSTDLARWKDFDYYNNYQKESYMYYQDVDYDNDGTYDYRGVYFIKYRPYNTRYESSEDNSRQDDNDYLINKVYWFKYEPIEWRVLDVEKGKALIIANLILDGQQYCHCENHYGFTHNGAWSSGNDYYLSEIRIFLNNHFWSSAFNDAQKEIIETQTASITRGSTKYYYEDKVELLSKNEAIEFMNTASTKKCQGTDYAKVQGIVVDSKTGNSNWTLKGLNEHHYDTDGEYSDYVTYDGNYDYSNVCVVRGIRPICYINL